MADIAEIRAPVEQEGTKSVVRAWLRKVGERVKRDEPLVELETDKVAVEVPSPADGVLTAIALDVGDEVTPGVMLGSLSLNTSSVIPDALSAIRNPDANAPLYDPLGSGSDLRSARNDGAQEQRLSPLVKRLLAEHSIDASQVRGSGRDGRITHEDVQAFLKSKSPSAHRPASAGVSGRIPHDPMRKSIAEHMARSLATAPHVTAVFEADFSAVAAHRAKHKAASERAGAPLTYSAYIVAACVAAMKVSPKVNSRWHDDALEMFEDVNIGVGVSLGEQGLIVPVIQRAQTLSFQDIAKRLADLTERARAGKLTPADVQNGTFTISNHGVSGSLIATPIIINQGQAAILGVGKLEKRVVVREVNGADTIQVRPMAYVSLTIDHRVLDGHQTNAWLTRFVEVLETWPQDEII